MTLLYTSTSTARDVAEYHDLDPKSAPRGVLVGVGELAPVRKLTREEHRQIIDEFYAHQFEARFIEPSDGLYRYEFKNLRRFKNPVSFKPPQGAVRTFKVPLRVVAKALKRVGIDPNRLR